MNFSPIYWLRLAKPVKIKTHIDGHYIYKLKSYFVVFTSEPINGIKCTKVSNNNIVGADKPQYIAHVIHKHDPTLHHLTQPKECHSYYSENKTEVDFVAENIIKDYTNN